MAGVYCIELSALEITVIAALLGYDSVLGIPRAIADDTDIKAELRRCVAVLEGKGHIRYELDGALLVRPKLKAAVECLCDAQTAGVFSSNLSSGKRLDTYVMKKGMNAVFLECTDGKAYTLCLTEGVYADALIPLKMLSSESRALNELMLLVEARQIHEDIASFDTERAQERIKKHIKDAKAASDIASILSGSCGYLSIEIFQRKGRLYLASYSTLLAYAENGSIEVRADENDVICFSGASIPCILEKIHKEFMQ